MDTVVELGGSEVQIEVAAVSPRRRKGLVQFGEAVRGSPAEMKPSVDIGALFNVSSQCMQAIPGLNHLAVD